MPNSKPRVGEKASRLWFELPAGGLSHGFGSSLLLQAVGRHESFAPLHYCQPLGGVFIRFGLAQHTPGSFCHHQRAGRGLVGAGDIGPDGGRTDGIVFPRDRCGPFWPVCVGDAVGILWVMRVDGGVVGSARHCYLQRQLRSITPGVVRCLDQNGQTAMDGRQRPNAQLQHAFSCRNAPLVADGAIGFQRCSAKFKFMATVGNRIIPSDQVRPQPLESVRPAVSFLGRVVNIAECRLDVAGARSSHHGRTSNVATVDRYIRQSYQTGTTGRHIRQAQQAQKAQQALTTGTHSVHSQQAVTAIPQSSVLFSFLIPEIVV